MYIYMSWNFEMFNNFLWKRGLGNNQEDSQYFCKIPIFVISYSLQNIIKLIKSKMCSLQECETADHSYILHLHDKEWQHVQSVNPQQINIGN